MTDTAIPRSTAAIVERIKELGISPGADPHGIERSRLLEALPWKYAQTFLRPDSGHDEKIWEEQRTVDQGHAAQQIRDYLPFAWKKANECRAISAQRSLAHFRGLLWLMGDEHEELRQRLVEGEAIEFYGKPQLVEVSEWAGVQWRKLDNDEWRRSSPDDEPISADEALGID